MKKLPWSSMTSGLVRNFLVLLLSCAVTLDTIIRTEITKNTRLMHPSLLELGSHHRDTKTQRLLCLCVSVVTHRYSSENTINVPPMFVKSPNDRVRPTAPRPSVPCVSPSASPIAAQPPTPVSTATYCLPLCMYVMGLLMMP